MMLLLLIRGLSFRGDSTSFEMKGKLLTIFIRDWSSDKFADDDVDDVDESNGCMLLDEKEAVLAYT